MNRWNGPAESAGLTGWFSNQRLVAESADDQPPLKETTQYRSEESRQRAAATLCVRFPKNANMVGIVPHAATEEL
jgi:hypothetical protein